MAAWSTEDLEWARECAGAGDTLEEIGAVLGRSPAEVQAAIGVAQPLSPRESEAASLYAAGSSMRAIGETMSPEATRPKAIASRFLQRARRKGFDIPYRRPDREARHA